MMAAVVKVPKLGPLILGIPLAEGIAEGIDAFLGARFLLVAPRTAKSRVKAALGEPIEQRARLQQAATLLRTQVVRVGAFVERLLIFVDDQLRADVPCVP